MPSEVVPQSMRVRETLRTLRAGETLRAVVEGVDVPTQCEPGGVGFGTLAYCASQFLHYRAPNLEIIRLKSSKGIDKARLKGPLAFLPLHSDSFRWLETATDELVGSLICNS